MTSDQAQRDPVNGTTEPLLPGEEESAGDVGATPSADGLSRPSHGWFRELRELLYLSASIFVLRVSWVVIKTTDSALLGYTGTRYLAAASISDLWTQSTGVFIMGGVLGMFCSQAIGSGNKQMAGIWLQVSLTVLSAIFIPVALSWALTGPLLLALGEPREVADDASYYALVLMACLPARIGISQISQFFTSQKIMHPGMTTGFVAMLMNLCLGLVFVLGIPVPGWSGFGFPACPLVTSVVEYCQLALLLGVYWVGMKLYRDCWPEAGWSWSHVTRARVHEFCRIYFPAALSLASDFWRVAAIGAVAAQLGAEEVSVFNCSYRIMWIALTFIGSMGGAMAIHLGVALGAGDTHQAKLCARVCIGTCVVAVALLAGVMLFFARYVAMVFSPDEAIQELFHEVRVPMVAMMVLMTLAVLLERIPMAMGRTSVVLGVGLVGSWVGQVPGVYIGVYLWRNDLVGLFTGVACGYALLCLLLTAIIMCTNWERFSLEAQRRSETAKTDAGGPREGNATE